MDDQEYPPYFEFPEILRRALVDGDYEPLCQLIQRSPEFTWETRRLIIHILSNSKPIKP
jgi:hypothetical protein